MDWNNILLFFINIIHLFVILFVVLVPFSNNVNLLCLHFITVPFIMIHWFLNNDTCALTIAEKFVRSKINNGREIDSWECLSHRIISPIYKFTSNNIDHSQLSWTITIILWFVTCYKLYNLAKNKLYK